MIVYHIARNPYTGFVTAISSIAKAQRKIGIEVKLVLLTSADYKIPKAFEDLEIIRLNSPKLFGTAAFLYHNLENFLHRSNWIKKK